MFGLLCLLRDYERRKEREKTNQEFNYLFDGLSDGYVIVLLQHSSIALLCLTHSIAGSFVWVALTDWCFDLVHVFLAANVSSSSIIYRSILCDRILWGFFSIWFFLSSLFFYDENSGKMPQFKEFISFDRNNNGNFSWEKWTPKSENQQRFAGHKANNDMNCGRLQIRHKKSACLFLVNNHHPLWNAHTPAHQHTRAFCNYANYGGTTTTPTVNSTEMIWIRLTDTQFMWLHKLLTAFPNWDRLYVSLLAARSKIQPKCELVHERLLRKIIVRQPKFLESGQIFLNWLIAVTYVLRFASHSFVQSFDFECKHDTAEKKKLLHKKCDSDWREHGVWQTNKRCSP